MKDVSPMLKREADRLGLTFDYHPDCPACLRNQHHTAAAHDAALNRNAEASAPAYHEDNDDDQ